MGSVRIFRPKWFCGLHCLICCWKEWLSTPPPLYTVCSLPLLWISYLSQGRGSTVPRFTYRFSNHVVHKWSRIESSHPLHEVSCLYLHGFCMIGHHSASWIHHDIDSRNCHLCWCMCGHMAFLYIHQCLENRNIISGFTGVDIKLKKLTLQKISVSIFKVALDVESLTVTNSWLSGMMTCS
jgi:hypothetical protein